MILATSAMLPTTSFKVSLLIKPNRSAMTS